MRSAFFVIATFCLINAHAQKTYSSESDVFNAKEITFFGYDFSHFTLAEAKRFNSNNILKYIPAWIGYLNEYETETILAERLNKDKVVFDFNFTTGIIRTLKSEDLVSLAKNSIHRDSVQRIISGYNLAQKEGIGFVVVVECFEKVNKTSSAYFTFFDIATKKILLCDYFAYDDAGGTGLTKFWGNGLATTFYKYLFAVYSKKANGS